MENYRSSTRAPNTVNPFPTDRISQPAASYTGTLYVCCTFDTNKYDFFKQSLEINVEARMRNRPYMRSKCIVD